MATGYRITVRQGFNGEERLLNSDVGSAARLVSASVTKDVSAYDSLTLTIPPTHKQYANFNMYTTFIKVTRPDKNKLLFDGRVITPSDSMDTSGNVQKQITAEHITGFLHDSVPPFHEFHNTTTKQFLAWLINEHNKQVEGYKKISLGNVTVTNSTDNVYRFTDETKDTYDNIQDKLVSRLGGEIRLREAGGLVLDYVPKLGGVAQQPIMLRRNLMSLTRQTDPSQIVTVLKPLGATQEPKEGGDTSAAYPRLNISSVNKGDIYLRDNALIQEYGTHVKTVTWDDVTTASALKAKGQAELKNQKNLKTQIQLGYVDLSHIKPDSFDEFELGDMVRIVNPIQGIDMTERITSMSIDFLNISNSSLTIGEDAMSLRSYEKMQQRQRQAETDALRRQLIAQQKIVAGYDNKISAINKNWKAEADKLASQGRDMNEIIKDLQSQIDKISSGTKPPDDGDNDKPIHVGKIIDISEFQAGINWSQVKNDDVSLATIRVQDGTSHEDLRYKNNIPNAINAGVNYAVYAFFRGQSNADAQAEARNFYNRTQSAIGSRKQPTFYMIDVETLEMSNNYGAMRGGVEAYMNQLNMLGVPDNKIVLYIANNLYSNLNLNVGRAGSIWLPSYGINDGTIANSRKPTHPYDLWQYTSVGRINGITGNVDMSTEPSERFKNQYLK